MEATAAERSESVEPFLAVFEPVEARFVRLTVLGINEGSGVCLDELEVYAPKLVENIALRTVGAKASASSCIAGNPKHQIEHLNDGQYGNEHSWIAASAGIEWAQIELPKPMVIDTVAFSRDRTGNYIDRTPSSFRIEVSLDGTRWKLAALFPGPGGGVRGRLTADRQPTPPPIATDSIQSPTTAPRNRQSLFDPKPQWTPAGESLCLNGDDWWMQQVAAEPHWDAWPPEAERSHSLADTLPSHGVGERTPWIRATVPGSVQTALLENGLAPSPWYEGCNFRAMTQATVGKQTWFFKRFDAPDTWRGRRVRLRLSAVDYRAQYYMNGNAIGQSEGHFAPVVFDVASHLLFGQQNILAVQIDAFPYQSPLPAQEGRAFAAQLARSQILANWLGGDFAPASCPLGITDDVHLLVGRAAVIDDIWVRPILSEDLSQATVRLQTTIDSQEALDVIVKTEIGVEDESVPIATTQRTVTLTRGINVVDQTVELAQPQLWWPNGYGSQAMHKAIVTLCDTRGQALHRQQQSFGIRRLEKVFNDGHDLSPYPWTFVINGKKIYAKGGGWVPVTPFHAMDTRRYERILRQAKAAHFTMVRWWGGGEPERPAFYDLCDRLGLMVYQDFFLANNEHDNPRFLRLLDTQAPAFVKRLRNHPSIVQWTAGNELFNGTVNYEAQAKIWEIIGRFDPDRPFCPSCPTIGVKHAITDYSYDPDRDYAAANRFGADPELAMKIRAGQYPDWQIIGQPHNDYYQAWIRRLENASFDPGNPAHHANAFDIQLTAEGGASTVANYATLQKIIPAGERSRFNDAGLSPSWLYHNARPGGYDWLQHATTERLFGPVDDLSTYVTVAQFSRGQILGYGLEEMRRRKFHTSGTLMWQLNETWPNAAGNALVDYFGLPRITYDFVQQAYEPVHASLRFDRITWKGGETFEGELWLTSDLPDDPMDGEVAWKVVDSQGQTTESGTQSVRMQANTSQKVKRVRWLIPVTYDSFFVVYVSFRDRGTRQALSETGYVHTAHTSSPHALAPLLTAEPTSLALRTMSKGEQRASFEIQNTGKQNAFICRLTVDHPVEAIVTASTNSFCLAPGAARLVELEAIAPPSAGWKPNWDTVTCNALNAPTAPADNSEPNR